MCASPSVLLIEDRVDRVTFVRCRESGGSQVGFEDGWGDLRGSNGNQNEIEWQQQLF